MGCVKEANYFACVLDEKGLQIGLYSEQLVRRFNAFSPDQIHASCR